MTPADELRQAAATLRDRAAKATPGPWTNHVGTMVHHLRGDSRRQFGYVAGTDHDDNARWIATTNPAVAEPLAVMLDWVAWMIQSGDRKVQMRAAGLALAREINKTS